MLVPDVALLHRFPPLLFFVNDTATTEIYTLSLHDALPISRASLSSSRCSCSSPTASRPTCSWAGRSEEHTSELQSHVNLVCRLLLEKKNTTPGGALLLSSS